MTQTDVLALDSGDLKLHIEAGTGRWLGLYGGKSQRNWLSSQPESSVGLPFVGGDAVHGEQYIPMDYTTQDDASLKAVSRRGETNIHLKTSGVALSAEMQLPDRRGPRSGWCLDLDHLDLPGGAPKDQLMPVAVATAEDLSWAYLVWHRADDDFLITTMEGPFAGWLIQYSYAGHRMEGFQVLARADDVIAPLERFRDGRLPATTQLKLSFALAESREEAIQSALEMLDMAAFKPSATAVVRGGVVSFEKWGTVKSVRWRKPGAQPFGIPPITSELELDEMGVHTFEVTAENGRVHETRILVLGNWQEMTSRCVSFHREHYQLNCGAFARCVSGDTLRPDNKTIEGTPFGDPEVGMSCRTGEFGGYGAWAQLRYMRAFGDRPEMRESIQAYFDWLTNKGREDNPRPGTLCYQKQVFNGIEWGPYHFYQEVCYAQHEAWLMGQMAEAIDMGWDHLIEPLVGLSRHFIDEHMDENGVVWNQNFEEETPVDYCTVDAPPLHVIAAGKALKAKGEAIGDELLSMGRKSIEHLYARGFNFPTEGEACTEDGSIACQAWALATGYLELENPDPKWLKMAEDLMVFHSKLEMSGLDIRTDGSSLRFWETMYESNDYGPSINASHGWTIWSAWARWACFLGTADFEHLWQAWRHTMCVAHRLGFDGRFPSSYTPDVIPALPHDDGWGHVDKRYEGRLTTTVMGLRYPDTLSMSGMHLFIMAPRSWYFACGYDASTGRLVNAKLVESEAGEGMTLVPNTALDCTVLALGNGEYAGLCVEGLSREEEISIYQNGEIRKVTAPEGVLELRA